MTTIDTHNLICDFGRHKGEPYTRLPVNYLLWMVNSNHSHADIAESELKRRGTVFPDLDISGHAIDRVSIHSRKIWHETKLEDEGLHAWLLRVCKEALEANKIDKKGRYKWGLLRFVIEMQGKWPILKTVIRLSKNEE